MERLPWINRPIAVHTYGADGMLSEAMMPMRCDESLAAAGDLKYRYVRPLRSHDLGTASDLRDLGLHLLLGWLDSKSDELERTGRSSYEAWTCAGQRMLSLKRAKRSGAVSITAGVAYTSALPVGEKPAFEITVTKDSPLSENDLGSIKRRVNDACKRRLDGDPTYPEHRMQATLLPGGLKELGIVKAEREYPAWRSIKGSGLIDFLGVDKENRLHVIETKANPHDEEVVLQALDYAVWVQANQAEIRATMRPAWDPADRDEGVVIDFICARRIRKSQSAASNELLEPYGDAIGPYMSAQLDALSSDFERHIWLVDDLAKSPCRPKQLPNDEISEDHPWVAKQIRRWPPQRKRRRPFGE
jgi:hypothetical protein